MKNSRLFKILYLLVERRSVTARELAERLEVSERTIYRDVDALSAAGIPVFTQKGQGGGIRLMEQFVLDRALLSQEEQDAYYPKGHIPKPAESQHLRENNRRPAPGPLFFHTCKRPTADRSKNPMARRPSKRRQFPRVPASPIPPA